MIFSSANTCTMHFNLIKTLTMYITKRVIQHLTIKLIQAIKLINNLVNNHTYTKESLVTYNH